MNQIGTNSMQRQMKAKCHERIHFMIYTVYWHYNRCTNQYGSEINFNRNFSCRLDLIKLYSLYNRYNFYKFPATLLYNKQPRRSILISIYCKIDQSSEIPKMFDQSISICIHVRFIHCIFYSMHLGLFSVVGCRFWYQTIYIQINVSVQARTFSIYAFSLTKSVTNRIATKQF